MKSTEIHAKLKEATDSLDRANKAIESLLNSLQKTTEALVQLEKIMKSLERESSK